MQNNDNYRDFNCKVKNQCNGIEYTIAWEEEHPSSFRIMFESQLTVVILDDEHDPEIDKVSKYMENLGFHKVMDHTVKMPGKPASYSLRFKKINEEETTNREMMNIARALAVFK